MLLGMPRLDRRRRLCRVERLKCLTALAVCTAWVGAFAACRQPAVDEARNADVSAQPVRIRLAAAPDRPQLMFVSVAADDSHRRLSVAPLDNPERSMFVAPLSCERIYFAGSNGICLSTASGPNNEPLHFAEVFDEHFEPTHRLKLTGPPSRVRISPDGRRAGATVFESGHSYAQEGFSTRTVVIDLAEGKVIRDLEDFAVWREGARIKAVDFNFWGLTFERDGNGFYATLDTGGV